MLKCKACGFIVQNREHQTHHILYHIMADTLLIELLNEASPNYYPLQFQEM